MDMQASGGGPAARPVWDGTAWVVPGTRWRWDGVAWVDGGGPPAPIPQPAGGAPPAGPVGAPPGGGPVGAGTVFGQVLWRVLLASVAGGAVVASLAVVVLFVASGDGDTEGIGLLLLAPVLGAVFGVILGAVAGPVLGGVCAWALVPYPGAAACRRTARVAAVVLVAVFLAFMLWGAVVEPVLGLLVVPSLVGAWFGGGWVIGWYPERMGDAR